MTLPRIPTYAEQRAAEAQIAAALPAFVEVVRAARLAGARPLETWVLIVDALRKADRRFAMDAPGWDDDDDEPPAPRRWNEEADL